MTDGNHPSEATSDRATALKRLTATLGALNFGSELTLVAINALLLRSTARYLITG